MPWGLFFYQLLTILPIVIKFTIKIIGIVWIDKVPLTAMNLKYLC